MVFDVNISSRTAQLRHYNQLVSFVRVVMFKTS
jgi:hypothetical protein